jgi:hypothetical protein
VTAPGLIDAVDRVVWNRDGSYALLYSSSANRLQRVRLSEAGPGPEADIDLSPWGPVTTLALDPAGRQIAFGVSGMGLYLLETGRAPVLLLPLAQPAAVAFDGSGRRLYAADPDRQKIWVCDSGSSASEFSTLEPADPSAAAVVPVGLAVSGDDRHLLLADGASRTIRVYDTTSGSAENTLTLNFTPTRFEMLSADPSFLLNGDIRSEWLLILNAKGTPGLSFVPANQENLQ